MGSVRKTEEEQVMQSDLTFVLHCSNCGLNGEIDEYTPCYQCPECHSEMVISRVKTNVSCTKLETIVSVVFLNDESIERDCYETRESMKKLNIDPEKTWYVVGTFEAQNIFGVRILSVNVTVFL